ncbi:MAG: glycoside hydrolase family 99-like domain-containing protein [Spirochaetes bacterium]|nr:glycoside hydrolase family 99-like domain-containing protein [Spirochaetota bacterium]
MEKCNGFGESPRFTAAYRRRVCCAVVIAFFIIGTVAYAAGKEGILTGVIRWSAWKLEFQQTRYLEDPQWHTRIPYYADVRDGKILMDEYQQNVMDQDILYAASAGLDYWAVNYRVWPRDLRNDPKWKWYTPDLPSFHRKSKYKDRLNYCLFLQDHLLGPKQKEYDPDNPGAANAAGKGADSTWDPVAEWKTTADELVRLFREQNYQKVLGNRPLVFIFGAQKFAYFKTYVDMKAGFEELSRRCEAAGLGKPYYVAMIWLGGENSRFLDDIGYDAVSGYGAPIHPEIRKNRDKRAIEYPYAKLAEANAAFRDACRSAGRQVIPPVNDGWDSRPAQVTRFPLYDRPAEGAWFTRGTADELTENVRSACQWVIDNPKNTEVKSILIYNWSEFVEGGWICPTLDEGTARLHAIKRALETFR